MDLVSHGLMGTMMAGLGLKKQFGIAGIVTMVIANIAPDMDIITGLKGPKAFYKYHREVTHSLLGAAILWILISLGIYFFTSLNDLGLVLSMVGIGLAGHLVMDSLTPWGLPLFYPLSGKKYGFDLIWFFDPVVVSSMIAGVYLAYIFPGFETVFYSATFILVFSYLFLRVVQKRRARVIADSEVTPRFKDAAVSVLPSAVSPFLWDVIFKSRGQYLYVSVDTRKKKVLASREFMSSSYHWCVKASSECDMVDVFLKRARFPFYSVSKQNGCYKVEWFDVQLLNLGGVHGIGVTVDENGLVIETKLHIKKPVRRKKRKIEEYCFQEET